VILRSKAYVYENLYSPKVHDRYRQETDMYKRHEEDLTHSTHYNMAVARFLTTSDVVMLSY